jgi:hypothetical protein
MRASRLTNAPQIFGSKPMVRRCRSVPRLVATRSSHRRLDRPAGARQVHPCRSDLDHWRPAFTVPRPEAPACRHYSPVQAGGPERCGLSLHHTAQGVRSFSKFARAECLRSFARGARLAGAGRLYRPAISLRALSPRSVSLLQLHFASFAVVSSRRHVHLHV